jgi:hypothetical protein
VSSATVGNGDLKVVVSNVFDEMGDDFRVGSVTKLYLFRGPFELGFSMIPL